MTVNRAPDFLRGPLSRLDRLLQRAVLAMRVRRPLTQDEFCGLYVSDEQVDAALAAHGWPLLRTAAEPGVETDGENAEVATPWTALTARFGLTPAERDVLLLGLAPQIDRRYETVFAYLNDSLTATLPTVDLALRALAGQPGVADALAPSGRLAAHGLIELVDAPWPIAWRARCFLGSDLVALTFIGAEVAAATLGLDEVIDRLPVDPDLVARVTACSPAPVLCFPDRPAAPAAAEAAALMEALGRTPVLVCGMPDDATGAALRRLCLAAHLAPLGLILERPGGGLLDAVARHWPADAPLAVTSANIRGAELDRPVHVIAPQRHSSARRAALWRTEAGCAPDIAAELGRAFALGPPEIRRAAATARLAGGPSRESLFAAARSMNGADFGPLAQRIPSRRVWSDLVLAPSSATALASIASAVDRRRQVFVDWGFERIQGGGALAALFSGPSGTGKTMAAGVLAGHSGLDLWRIDLSAVVDKYIGETEKNLERVFAAAAACDAVLLFDEADALFGKRTETRDARDRYANLEVSYLLQRIESLPPGVVVVLTTNLAKNMDQAFVRRLTHVVDFPRPSAELRVRLWAGIFPEEAPCGPDLDPERLARDFDLTGGEIKQVALDAAFRAAGAGRRIGMPEVAAALERHFEKLGRTPPRQAIEGLVLPGPVATPRAFAV